MQLTNLFRGWEAKEKIVRPVIVNLTTASVVFLAAVLFKDPLYRYFIWQPNLDWPIYCVLEPHVNLDPRNRVSVDLFVINTEANNYSSQQLVDLADQQSKKGRSVSSIIRIVANQGFPADTIENVFPDDEFNIGKGSATVQHPT